MYFSLRQFPIFEFNHVISFMTSIRKLREFLDYSDSSYHHNWRKQIYTNSCFKRTEKFHPKLYISTTSTLKISLKDCGNAFEEGEVVRMVCLLLVSYLQWIINDSYSNIYCTYFQFFCILVFANFRFLNLAMLFHLWLLFAS